MELPFRGLQLITDSYLTSELYDNYVGAVVCSRGAYRVCECGPTLYTGVIGISVNVGHRRDQHTIAVNVEVIRRAQLDLSAR
jgi:hypothetical protein